MYCILFDKFHKYKIQLSEIKACHTLPSSAKIAVTPVIVKFVYFHKKKRYISEPHVPEPAK